MHRNLTPRQQDELLVHERNREEGEPLLTAAGFTRDPYYVETAWERGQPMTAWNGPAGLYVFLIGLGKWELRRDGVQLDGARTRNVARLMKRAARETAARTTTAGPAREEA